jgi:hypothetical protein
MMVAYLGLDRSTEVEVDPVDLGCGAGLVTCFECGGSGDWARFHPEPDLFPDGLPCVPCKGTGKVLISI